MNVLASMRYLVALNEQKHFGRAAQACHITQPALSNAMRVLEREFGVVIIRRGRTFVGLTPEGERVLASAQRMLHEHNLLQQELKSEAGRVQGPLRLGAVPTAIPVLARFAAMLRVRQPGIVPAVISLSSSELEAGIDSLSLDLALGYTERVRERKSTVTVYPQYIEHYFYLHRAAKPAAGGMKIGARVKWKDVAQHPLAMLTPEMHNRTIIDSAFATAGTPVKPAIETNSILSLALSVVEGDVSTVMPGALVAAVRGYRELEANPLTSPEVRTPIGFMSNALTQPSRALAEAIALAQDKQWLRHAALHSGLLAA
ncbi:LysR family transcriptional regulator [Caenimonas koreensis DSM 17982]|uniref:LysR family transcriptional regulator n=1 Tax=Caenimonas koreensis DSM 17982 TaxID=1121255 RepID=A0A844B8V8_9BURK|nr:LysR family transcriptional regulator [Caenimonas koreensis]MRD48039.1 LysR family transcriptional regulator [Caenimonas koreensis DSM 17982]